MIGKPDKNPMFLEKRGYQFREKKGMMLETILKRRSYRGKYKNVKVPREHLTAIMEAGLAAPSGCNKQTTSLIAVDDEAILAQHYGFGLSKLLV